MIVEIIVAAWLILAIRDSSYRPKYSHILASLGIFVAVILAADLFGLNFFKSFWSNFERMEGFGLLLHLLGYFLVVGSVLKTDNLWKRFFHTWIGVGFFLCLYGILQLAGEVKINQGGVRLDGTFGNATYFAVFLFFIIFFCLLYALRKKEFKLLSTIQSLGTGFFLSAGYTFYSYYGRTANYISEFAFGQGRNPTSAEIHDHVPFFIGPVGKWLFFISLGFAAFELGLLCYRKKLALAGHALAALGGGFVLLSLYYTVKNYSEYVKALGFDSLGLNSFNVPLLISIVSLLYMFLSVIWRKTLVDAGDRILANVHYIILALFAAVMLFNTATRGAFFGLLAGLFITPLIIAIGERERKILRRASIGFLVFFVIVVGAFVSFRDAKFIQKSPTLYRLASVSTVDKLKEELKVRSYVWNTAWQGVKESPILGYGQENFNYVFNKYYDPRMYSQEQWFDHTHNIIFDWLISGGFLGLISYLSILYFLFYCIWKKRTIEDAATDKPIGGEGKPGPDFSLAEKAVLSGLIVGYFLQNLTVFDNTISYALFFSLLGYVHNYGSKPVLRFETFDTLKRPAVYWSTVAVISAALIGSIYVFNIRGINTAEALIGALKPHKDSPVRNIAYYDEALQSAWLGRQETIEQLSVAAPKIRNLSVPIEAKQKIYKLATDGIEAEMKRNPDDARLRMFAGVLYSYFENYSKALEHFAKAQKLSPRKQTALMALGSTYLSLGDFNKAFDFFEEAYLLATDFKDAEEAYLVGAVYSGRMEILERFLQRQYENTKDKNNFRINQRIVQTLMSTGKFKEAAYWLEKVLESDPGNVDNRMSLAISYFELGRRSDSIRQLEVIKTIVPAQKDRFDRYIAEIRAGRRPQ